MLIGPFLTDLDQRAAIKGSRDPLGIQQIWTRLGRTVIGNLTTVSTSVTDFTVLLLGYYFAERLSDDLGPGSELETFLKWEQLAGYARGAINRERSFRGTERVHKRLGDGDRVSLSGESVYQILSNQKIYGLWGLYTVPARASGLLDADPPRLTAAARELLDCVWMPMLADDTGKDAKKIVALLRQPRARVEVDGRERPILAAVARLLKHKLASNELECYRSHLRDGGPADSTHGRQAQLAQLLDDGQLEWSPAMVRDLAKKAHRKGTQWHPLADRLSRIATCENVVAPVSSAFAHMLGLDGKAVNVMTQRLREKWEKGLRAVDVEEFRAVRPEIGANDAATGDRWVAIAECVATGEYDRLVQLMIEQNRSVMAARGGAPWLELRSGKFHVRFRDEREGIPDRQEAARMWRFPYFLDSLRQVTLALN